MTPSARPAVLANTVDADYYQSLREDKSNPLWNYATQEQTAPGSTFKMVSSTAGLAEGVIDTSSKINCTGIFTEISIYSVCKLVVVIARIAD